MKRMFMRGGTLGIGEKALLASLVFAFLCTFCMKGNASSVSANEHLPDHAITLSGLAQEAKVVISTIVPNEEDPEFQEAVRTETRSLEALEKEIVAEQERLEVERIQQERKDYISSIACDTSDVSIVSGLKEEDFKYLTEGTWWEGHETILFELERDYSVNAMFAMSVSTLESGHGTSVRANRRCNFYGIELDRSWASLYDNSLWWGNMIKTGYVERGAKSVWNIAPIYCPPNSDMWGSYMHTHMNELYASLINKLNDTVE